MIIKELKILLEKFNENLEIEISAERCTYGSIKNIYLDGEGITFEAEY